MVETAADDRGADLAEKEVVGGHVALVEHEEASGDELAGERQREDRTASELRCQGGGQGHSAPAPETGVVVQQHVALRQSRFGCEQRALRERWRDQVVEREVRKFCGRQAVPSPGRVRERRALSPLPVEDDRRRSEHTRDIGQLLGHQLLDRLRNGLRPGRGAADLASRPLLVPTPRYPSSRATTAM